MRWKFRLDAPAPCDGYFVQKVTEKCAVDDGCGKCTPTPKSVTYWEVWFVQEGQILWQGERGGDSDSTDDAIVVIPDKTCGYKIQSGIVRFYCRKDIKDDLGAFGKDPKDPMSKWRIRQSYGTGNCRVTAGLLPSVGEKDAPSWWNDVMPVAEKTAIRVIGAKWCCCGTRKDSVDANAYPNRQEQIPPEVSYDTTR
jgi:hypothetical protein